METKDIIVRVILAAITIYIVSEYLAPLLMTFFPPFGLVILIAVIIAIIAYVLGKL